MSCFEVRVTRRASPPASPYSGPTTNGPTKEVFCRLGKEAIAARTIEPQACNALAELNQALARK